jgi:hypothetical protein
MIHDHVGDGSVVPRVPWGTKQNFLSIALLQIIEQVMLIVTKLRICCCETCKHFKRLTVSFDLLS